MNATVADMLKWLRQSGKGRAGIERSFPREP